MTQTILAFGDSNTHGTPPMANRNHHPRLKMRWPLAFQNATGCTLIEDGLPGRTACQIAANSPDLHLDGHLGLRMALLTHGPIDHLFIMLGTNDLQTKYGKSLDAITAGIAGLLAMAHANDIQNQHGGFQTTLICPPPVRETGSFVPEFLGGAAKSRALPALFAALAAAWNTTIIDAGQFITTSPADGVHFDADAHKTLGLAIAEQLSPSFE